MAAITAPVEQTFADFLAADAAKDLLRFTTAGSVDDGKSTLIGRLLYDSRGVFEDQLESVTKASVGRNAGPIDFSLLTDGLRAEREQGITIDVAYRYFATPRRKFIIADTPGHEQYTRNMVTGASTAELAIVLVDARKGLLPQSRRHAYIASLLGLPHLVVAVNKMDLVDYSEAVFRQIEADFREFLARLDTIAPYLLPISALAGDNVVQRSARMPWFTGPSLIEHLEQVPAGRAAERAPLRFPVQRVVRAGSDFRGYAGQLAAGRVHPGDTIVVLPSGRSARVERIVTFDGNREQAGAPESVTLTLDRDLDIGRGDLIAAPQSRPEVSRVFDATLVWLNDQPLQPSRQYRLKQTSRQETAQLKVLHHRIDVNTLAKEPAETLAMNDIGFVRLATARPLCFDSYRQNRTTGSFILIDPVTNATVAAGLIAHGIHEHGSERPFSPVTVHERAARFRHNGATLLLGDREGVAARLERRLFEYGALAVWLRDLAPESLEPLRWAGMLALVTSPQDAPLQLFHGESGQIPLALAELPDADDAAADAVYELLRQTGVLNDLQTWSERDGI